MSAVHSQTHVCVLTGGSKGALAVIHIWGPSAIDIADRVFRPNSGRRLSKGPRDRPRFGRVGTGLGDEVVAVILGEGREVEIHCHGGPQPIAMVMNEIIDHGAARLPAESWLDHDAENSIAADFEEKLNLFAQTPNRDSS